MNNVYFIGELCHSLWFYLTRELVYAIARRGYLNHTKEKKTM